MSDKQTTPISQANARYACALLACILDKYHPELHGPDGNDFLDTANLSVNDVENIISAFDIRATDVYELARP